MEAMMILEMNSTSDVIATNARWDHLSSHWSASLTSTLRTRTRTLSRRFSIPSSFVSESSAPSGPSLPTVDVPIQIPVAVTPPMTGRPVSSSPLEQGDYQPQHL